MFQFYYIYYVDLLFVKVNRNILLCQKSTHLQVIPQQITQNTASLPLQTCDKNQWNFLLYDTGLDFSSPNNFSNLGSFAIVSVPVKSIIPLLRLMTVCEVYEIATEKTKAQLLANDFFLSNHTHDSALDKKSNIINKIWRQ